MKRILPLAFIFLIACNKENVNHQPKVNGIVKYAIEGDSMQIIDSTSRSVARWIYSTTPSKGYALQAYNTKPGGEVSYLISFFIETDKIETGHNYSQEVTGSILRNNTDYASTKELQGTYINIFISRQQGQTLSGTFTGKLKNLNTKKLTDISGTFDNLKLLK